MKLPRRSFLHLMAGAVALPNLARRKCPDLSSAAGALCQSVAAGRLD